jgi:CHAT domain-containing protein
MDSLKKLISLGYQGKAKEAIALAKKISIGKDSLSPSGLYEGIGNYTKAELLIKQSLARTKSNFPEEILDQLSQLYEKMGNDDAAEAILEKLVASDYVVVDPKEEADSLDAARKRMVNVTLGFLPDTKAEYFAYQMKLVKEYVKARLIESKKEHKVDFDQVNSDTTEIGKTIKAIRYYYKSLIQPKFDSLETVKSIEKQWETDSLRKIQLYKEYQNSPYMNSRVKMVMMATAKPALPPSTEKINLLKEGKLKFTSIKYGVNILSTDRLQRLFMLYKRQHNYIAAESLIKQAIAIDEDSTQFTFMKGLGFDPAQPARTSDTANNLDKYGFKGMSTIVKQGFSIYEKHSGVDIFGIQNKVLLAQLYQEMGEHAEYKLLADTIHDLCKEFDSNPSPIVINSIAESYVKIERYEDAETAYKKLVAGHTDEPGEINMFSLYYLSSLRELAKIYILSGRYAEAESALKEALAYDKAASREDYPDHLSTVIDLAQLYENTNRLSLAEQYCNSDMGPVLNNITNNFSFLSEQEKILWLNNQISAFDFSASLLLTDADPSDEFIIQTCNEQLQLKGLVLKDEKKVFEEIRKSGDPELKQLLNEWQSNRSAIAWQYSQPPTAITIHLIDSLSTIANEQEKKINQLSESFRDNKQDQEVDFKQVRHQLKDNEIAIEFVRFNYYHKKWTDSIKYGAFVILSHGSKPHFVPICNEARLARLLDIKNSSSFLDLYGYSKTNPSGKKSDSLYNLVWKPLTPFLKGITKIAIAPAGLLNRVAFNALPADSNNYLIDKYEIRQYSSVSEIAGQKIVQKPAHKTDAILYGGINYGERDSTALSGSFFSPLTTLNEVNDIYKLFKINNKAAKVITDAEATEESLKQLSGHSPWILHIATHGFSKPNADQTRKNGLTAGSNQFFYADNPMFRSGIIMAGANRVWSGGLPIEGKEDGIVTAYEIANLDLSKTDLVVLSACETALGDIKGTEGVFGLQRAFKLAGVKNMLLSLWPVPDEETTELMKEFYANKLSGMTNYQAFNSAQVNMRKNYPPYFWAGFVLIE